MMKFKLTTFLGIIFSLTAIGMSIAQGNCPLIVEQALQAMGDNCESLERNSACYGYNLVQAEFSEAVADDFFTHPADTTELALLESIRTSEMNVDTAQWGVAVMNLQANIPNSLPGQSVKFVLLGDVDVESAVEPSSVFEQTDAIDVVAIHSANIRSGPSLSFNVIGGITAQDTIPVDGKSTDGEWYRTVVGSRIGWIFGELIESTATLDNLPVIDGTQRSLMQSFYLRTGFGSPECDEAPQDTLMIQGPQGIEIDLTVNGADIHIGSTILARILQPGDIIEFIVVDGKLTIPGAGPNGSDLVVYENQRTTACLGEPDNRGVDGNSNDRIVECDWSSPETISDEDLGESFCALEDVPDGILNYSIDMLCPGEEPVTIELADTPEPDESASGNSEEDYNLCNPGNAWDDGRCNSDYWWQAGYYFGLYEAGMIDISQIPEQYNRQPTPTPTSEPDEEKKPKYCQFGGGGMWDIFNAKTEAYIETVSADPGYPPCPFG